MPVGSDRAFQSELPFGEPSHHGAEVRGDEQQFSPADQNESKRLVWEWRAVLGRYLTASGARAVLGRYLTASGARAVTIDRLGARAANLPNDVAVDIGGPHESCQIAATVRIELDHRRDVAQERV